MPVEQTGIIAAHHAFRDAVIARNPHLKAKLLGERPAYALPKETRITVDCRTGERTVEPISQLTPPPKPAGPVIIWPPPPRLPKIVQRQHVQRQPADKQRPARISAYNNRTAIGCIVLVCAKHWEIDPDEIARPGRNAKYVRPRFACMKLMRELLGLSMPAIGWALGRRDHTTALAAYGRAQEMLETDADWRRRYEAARAELTAESKGVTS